MIFGDVNLTEHSLVQKEFKHSGIPRLFLIVYEIKLLIVLFFTVKNNSNDLT
jgi:hypothetical protein